MKQFLSCLLVVAWVALDIPLIVGSAEAQLGSGRSSGSRMSSSSRSNSSRSGSSRSSFGDSRSRSSRDRDDDFGDDDDFEDDDGGGRRGSSSRGSSGRSSRSGSGARRGDIGGSRSGSRGSSVGSSRGTGPSERRVFLPPRVVNTVPYGRLGAPNQRAGLVTEHGFKRLGCRAQPVVADGHTFYRCGGTWYDPVVVSGEPAYIEVWAPPGVTVEALPPEAAQVTSSGKTYYVAGGEFYEAQTTGPGYVLVQPAKGTRLDSLPGGLKGRIGVFSDGQTYYPYQGVFYREVVEGTQTFYEVADSPFLPPQQTVPAPAAYGSTNKPPS